MITTYFLAANLLALTAFLLGLNNFSKKADSWRLLPLFLLVVCRALILILVLTGIDSTNLNIAATLDVFSVFCFVWALTDIIHLPPLWRRISWLGAGLSMLLVAFTLVPNWPVPPQIHSLTIAIFSVPLILVSLGRVSWLHLVAPLTLALGYFLSLLGLINVAWLVLLLAYVIFIAALHWEGVQTYKGRQQESEALARNAISLSEERQRLVEVSEIISAVPGVDQTIAHIARSMAHVTHSDQAAIFVLDVDTPEQFHLATVYSPERPVQLASRYERTFNLVSFLPLQTAIEQQEQLLLRAEFDEGMLSSLYGLWYEDRTGPTLIQPLVVHGQPVGAMLLGNPVTGLPFQNTDRDLCRSLAGQIAAMVDSQRYFMDVDPHGSTYQTAPAQSPQHYPSYDELPPASSFATEASMAGTNRSIATDAIAVSSRDVEPLPLADTLPIADTLSDSKFLDEISAEVFNEQITTDSRPILEALHEGVVVSDAIGRVQLVNRAAERILGQTREELLGRSISSIYGEIDSSESIEDLATAFSRRNEPLPTFVQSVDRAVQGQLVPWRNQDKEWMGIIAVFRDVTHKVMADRARNDFITALSRELRAPLTTIKGYSELIIRGDLADYSPEQLQVQQIMHSSADRMVAVLDNAIQIGAQNRNKVLPYYESVNVAEVIKEAMSEMSSLATIRELELTQDVEPGLPPVVADRGHLLRILENLVENACHFTPPGGQVAVRVWQQQERIGNTFKPELVITVTDNGVGIPPSEKNRIFEPFYQIKGVLGSGGMGMGLAVVKEMVDNHQGRVWVESVEGQGSTFHVALPFSQD